MTATPSNINICITRNQQHAYSETFIRNQIKCMGEYANVFTLYSGRLPEKEENGQLIYSYPAWFLHKIARAVTGNRNTYFSNRAIRKYLAAHHIDIVLANFGMSAVHMFKACKNTGVPVVPHFHGFDATKQKTISRYGELYKEMFAGVPAIIAVSNVMKEKLVNLGAPPEKVKVIPYGINLAAFTPALKKEHKDFTFLAVGRFTAKKSPLSTLQAFKTVSETVSNTRLIMVGGKEDLYEACEKFVADHNLTEKVIFTGILNSEAIAEKMQAANAFVQHSVTAANGDMEGTPLSILEALASGLPVISTRHGGIIEAVIDGKNGLLCNENDVGAMAENMIRLATAPDRAFEMGQAGRAHVEENYNLPVQTKKLWEVLYQSINTQ
ncbi:MAG: glycosyltransferase family 4 protein [Ferruginibacter sp.]